MVTEYYYVAGLDGEDDVTFNIKVLKQDFLASYYYDDIEPGMRDKLENKQYMIDYELEITALSDVHDIMHLLEDCNVKLSRADWKYTTNLSIILQ